jgi:hypothetical protein
VPSASGPYVALSEQDAKGSSSSAQRKLAASFAEKVKLAFVACVSASGRESIVVSGATVSTVKERVAGASSVLPAGSLARTDSV